MPMLADARRCSHFELGLPVLTGLTMPLIAGNYSEEISKNLQLLKRQL